MLKNRVAYKRFRMFVERAFRIIASVIARKAVNDDYEMDILEEYESMVAAMNVE